MAGCCCPGKGLGPPGALLGGPGPGPPDVGVRPGNGPRGGIMFGAPGGGPCKMKTLKNEEGVRYSKDDTENVLG